MIILHNLRVDQNIRLLKSPIWIPITNLSNSILEGNEPKENKDMD